jgi:SAM-dependent methyltransferase
MIVQIGLHNYDFIYSKPGLYDQLLYDELRCASPTVVTQALLHSAAKTGVTAEHLRCLDIGAGPGNVGELLAKAGASLVVNVDKNPLAKTECARVRPKTYNDYFVLDLHKPFSLKRYKFNALTLVAALSHEHIPVPAIEETIKVLEPSAFIATCIGEQHLDQDTPLSRLVWRFVGGLGFRLHHFERYRHRFTCDGRELYYYCIVTRKEGK